MKLLIKFPTRNRPDKFLHVLEAYINNMEDKSTNIIISADSDDETMCNDFIREVVSQYDNTKICFGDNKSKIEAINADFDGPQRRV